MEERRYNIYGVLENKHFFIKNVWLIVQHSLTTPGTKVAIEKLCFIVSVLWVIKKKVDFIFLGSNELYLKKNYYDFLLTEKIEENSFIKIAWINDTENDEQSTWIHCEWEYFYYFFQSHNKKNCKLLN